MTMRSASRFCSTRACRLDAGLLSVMQPLLETSPPRSRVQTLINLIPPLERTHITLGYGMAVLARDAVQQREGWKGGAGASALTRFARQCCKCRRNPAMALLPLLVIQNLNSRHS